MHLKWAGILAGIVLALSAPASAADAIKVGLTAEMTGPNAESGAYQVNGANLALDEINKAGGVLGRQLALKVEDTQSNNNGAVNALSRRGAEGKIVAIIGPVRSTQIQAMAPTLIKMGMPMLIGGTDPPPTPSRKPSLFPSPPNHT